MLQASNDAVNQLQVTKLAFDSLAKGVKLSDNPPLLQKVKNLYDPQNQQPAYPATNFIKYIDVLRQELYPNLSEENGLVELGTLGFQGFYQGTIIGGIMLAALKTMRPLRILKLGKRMWAEIGVGEVEGREISSHVYETQSRKFLIGPYFLIGMTVEAFRASGLKKVQYKVSYLPPSPGLHSHNFNVIYECEK
jgi:uncharacterized protein (TIGR02265 family)